METNKEYQLNNIYFYLTEGCNLRCRHCWLAPRFESGDTKFDHLDFDLMKDIVYQGKRMGVKGVKLTGGEPLMHDKILEILDFLIKEDMGITIETNGVLLNDEIINKLKKARRKFISVSLDGAQKDTHEWVRLVEGSFQKSITGIKKLADAGLKPQIIMSIMQHNKDQIEDMIELAEELGAGSVKINIVMPTERGKAMHESGETLNISELIEIGKWMENEVIPNSKIKVIYHHPIAFKSLSSIFGKTKEKTETTMCGIKGIIGVLANGKYALCGIGSKIPEMIFGDAKKDKLKDVWKNSSVLKDIRENIPKKLEGICSKCIMKEVCLGSCVAQNYYRKKNIWAPFWYCEEAEKAGLFPETRKVMSNEN